MSHYTEYKKFENEVQRINLPTQYQDGYGFYPLSAIYTYCVNTVKNYPDDYSEHGTGIFLPNELAQELEKTYYALSKITLDFTTYADELAMAFMFSFCDEVGGDYYLPGEES